VEERLQQMGREADALLAAEYVSAADRVIEHSVGLRFEGQAHEIDIAVVPDALDREALDTAFRDAYLEAWSYLPSGRPAQMVTLRVTAIGRTPKLNFPRFDNVGRSLAGAEICRRDVVFAGAAWDTPVYARTSLPAKACFRGPAVVEEDGSTTVVLPDWDVRIDEVGNLILDVR